jgi:hypothetical protein
MFLRGWGFIMRRCQILLTVLSLGSALSTAGCAYVTAVPAPVGANVSGIRVPDVKPLIVVGGSEISVLLVPNPNKQYALQFGAFLAKHDLSANFQQGMLASLTSNEDSTAVPVAFLGVLQQALQSGRSLGSAFSGTASGDGGRLQIYDVVFDDEGSLVGLKPLIRDRDLIRVPAGLKITFPPYAGPGTVSQGANQAGANQAGANQAGANQAGANKAKVTPLPCDKNGQPPGCTKKN